MFVGNDFLSCMAKDARLSSRVLARASPHTRLSTRVLQCTHKSQIWLLNQNQNNQTVLCLIQKLCVHPTSTKVSDQLTKMTKSYLQPMHMIIILYPVWAGFKCNSLDLCSIGVSKK